MGRPFFFFQISENYLVHHIIIERLPTFPIMQLGMLDAAIMKSNTENLDCYGASREHNKLIIVDVYDGLAPIQSEFRPVGR